jgi:hypothetical protein
VRKRLQLEREAPDRHHRVQPVEDLLAVAVVNARPVGERVPGVEEGAAAATQMRLALDERRLPSSAVQQVRGRAAGEAAAEDDRFHLATAHCRPAHVRKIVRQTPTTMAATSVTAS